jgi:hypothetical protein
MPLGSFPLGVGPLGHAPVADPSAPGAAQPLAPLIHPGTRDAIVIETGALQGVHPVDQAVSLAFAVRRGALAAVPSQGHRLLDLEHKGRGWATQVRLAVEEALAVLLRRGDIELLSVALERSGETELIAISYRNLRLAVDPSAPLAPTTLRVPVT